MSIHQISLAYEADQDRLRLRIRTKDEQLFELWLTRRLMLRLWQPLQHAASELALGRLGSGSTVLPEARDMMAQSMREKSAQKADFRSPFEESVRTRPLGEVPMLVESVDISRPSSEQLDVTLRDHARRSLTLNLSPELLSNTLTLLENALAQSEWGLVSRPSATSAAAAEQPPKDRVLN